MENVGAEFILSADENGLTVRRNEQGCEGELFTWDEIKHLVEPITYSVGDRIMIYNAIDGDYYTGWKKYIIASSFQNTISLIRLSDGYAWKSPLEVKDYNKIPKSVLDNYINAIWRRV